MKIEVWPLRLSAIQAWQIALCLVGLCALANSWLAADPVRHVLIQLPLLALAGWLLARPHVSNRGRWANGGYAPLIAVLFATIFWMLPRSIDAAVGETMHILAKFVSLPAMGALAAIGWQRGHPILRGFVKAQIISMSGFMAFLFTHAPSRLCNNYLIDAQWRLGEAFLNLALILAAIWTVPLFFPQKPAARRPIGGRSRAPKIERSRT